MDNPKLFRQRRPDPDNEGGWIWRLSGVRRVLYRLPEVLAASVDAPVFLVEGEKDANRLWMEGAVATTSPGGALKWREEYSISLAGRHVIIIPDNDPPSGNVATSLKGQKHAMLVARSLQGQAASVKVLELPDLPPKDDVSDFFDAGGTISQLYILTESAHEHTATAPYLPGGYVGP